MAFPLFNTVINNKFKVHKHNSSFQMRKAETSNYQLMTKESLIAKRGT
ncbi:hypothetical protein MtrunA17_Chr3g0112531 [Medicago truncatula]|uniref:Uncharacterized protein n=1 Tax=Medicago truncatula TaxID=3880 RepID=A0A396IUE0_MEDTR|nr:hypothetical protein MtrunA17_Chr3g0112531 [Medicago truncatula]